MRKLMLVIGLACGLFLLLITSLHAQAVEPLARHCGDVGPLPLDDPDFCGCTWGPVLFHGQPVSGAVVTLTYRSQVVTGTTRRTPLEPHPYFDLTAHPLGAQRGDLLTLTVQLGEHRISRRIRAWPDADGEQTLTLAFEERGLWQPLVTGGYTRALALARDTVWAGGPSGVISINLSSGVSVVHTLPLDEPTVRALDIDTDRHLWAAGDGGVAEFAGGTWQAHAVPLTGTPRALGVDATGVIWLGGGDAEGSIVAYDGEWDVKGVFSDPVTALTVDEMGQVWAGTWGQGVYRRDLSGSWHQYRTTDGLASDYVLAGTSSERTVWLGTRPYVSGGGTRGGIARFDLTEETWQVFTQAHGLPSIALSQAHVAPDWIYALASGSDGGTVWAGTGQGVSFLIGEHGWATYTATHNLRPGPVMAVAAGGDTVVAAMSRGLDILDRDSIIGEAPVAQIDLVTPLTLTTGPTLTLRGRGTDGDEGGGHIVAWDWTSDRDGTLCTAATCELPAALFSDGTHTLGFRVQDDEGVWSAPVTTEIWMHTEQHVYLPLIVRSKSGR